MGVFNSTVSENQAGHTTPANDPGTGGGVHLGIFPHENEEALDAHFQNSTITGNNADSGGGIYAMVPDVNYPAARNRVWLTNSIASANQSHSSNDNNLFGSFDVNATVYNVIGSGNSIWSHSDTSRVMLPASPDPLDDGTNILTDAPLLSPLAWHGGPTKTHRLLLGSPAIDAGSNMLAVVPFTNMQTALTTDQRSVGFPRSWNTPGVDWVGRGPVDIGAYEIGLPKVIDVTVDGSTSFHDPYSFAEQKATGSGEQVRTVPVGGADMFHIQFSETMNPATFAVSDLEVIGLKTATKPVPVSSGFSVNSTADVATWTFSDWSLGDNYLLSLAQYGQALDGEWVNPKSLSAVNSSGNISTFPSGDNVAGGQFDFVTTLLPGDADLNGVVDVADLGTLSEHYNQHNMSMDAVFSQADFTGDGVVDVADLGELGTNWQVNLQQIWILADLGPNPDDRVDAADDAILQSNYGMTNPTREDGDLDADGDVDGDDLLILQQMMGIDLDLAV